MAIAALFVEPAGAYFGLAGVDPWDKGRDARRYDGPWPVVVHSPCERWGRYAEGSPSNPKQFVAGDDDGCFEAALNSVRRWGGVLEHPANSKAWAAFQLFTPPPGGGWVNADFKGGWTCQVDQGNYGHRAPKPTWLYARGFFPPPLIWGNSKAAGRIELMGKRERKATPVPFRDLLIKLAEMAR